MWLGSLTLLSCCPADLLCWCILRTVARHPLACPLWFKHVWGRRFVHKIEVIRCFCNCSVLRLVGIYPAGSQRHVCTRLYPYIVKVQGNDFASYEPFFALLAPYSLVPIQRGPAHVVKLWEKWRRCGHTITARWW